MEPVLLVDGVSKRYGTTTILDGATFELPRGSATLLTGRSGSGKSTLFKLLAALDRPTSGRILVEGDDITTMDDDRLAELRLRRMGLVFQSYNLLPDLTAFENVRLPLDLAGEKRAAATTRAEELLALVGVSARRNARPSAMSGGEQQRVAVARALVNRPAILLADEPTGNLDRRNADNVFEVLRDVNAKLGTTLLVISHDDLAHQWFSRRMSIDDGRVTSAVDAPTRDARRPLPG